ncbi:MAG TPA: DUF177 domain-containing protein [Solirubrobacterales bacterium]|nr:DUF177 domain-containing protein [Solirubrobacterales bacterium]
MLIEKVDLDSLSLTYGDAKRIEGVVSPEEVELGGQTYTPDPAQVPFVLDVSRTSSGFALRLRFEVGLAGPCFRCLEPAVAKVTVDAREVDQPPEPVPARKGSKAGDEEQDDEDEATAAELLSPYVEARILDVEQWTHDALILALPNQIVCREDCLGLCPYCGETLNGADPADHDHGQNLDPRWSKLRQI